MRVPLQDFVWVPEEKLYIHPEKHISRYSDGQEIEERMLSILKNTEDRSVLSPELVAQITDWPTEYHFSPHRHLLLRHLPFGPSDKILELGCGCGAITRFLGETGAEVHSIEDGRVRAQCAAARCADLDNVKIFCADMRNVEYADQYDYVLLIGVMEYSPLFFEDEDPIAACLNLTKTAMNEHGRLVIAIENRLGLKYIMGLSEDHTNLQYFGIHDLYNRKTACTLGKKELTDKLTSTGFKSIQFETPFPDYKMPKVVLTQKAFEHPDFHPGEIVNQTVSRDYICGNAPAFLERLSLPILDQNGILPDLSHSFLIVASPTEVQAARENVLGTYYAVDRKPEFQTKTVFVLDEQNRPTVRKQRLNPDLPLSDGCVEFHPADSDYVVGVDFERELLKTLVRGDMDAFRKLCAKWVDYIKENGIVSGSGWDSLVRGDYLDCVPRNLILVDEDVKCIDLEWHYKTPLPLDFLICRGLYTFMVANYSAQHWQLRAATCGCVLKSMLVEIGLKDASETIERFVDLETAFETQAGGIGVELGLRGFLDRKVPAFTGMTSQEMQIELERLSSELEGIRGSKAWRVLQKIRLLRRAVGRIISAG